MNIEVFSLCDAATVDVGGKLNMLGAFDTIWAAGIPVGYPHFSIALRIRFQNIEKGEHRLVVNFVDADGKHSIPSVNSMVNINFPDEQRSGSISSVLNIQMLKFEKYGEYSIDLAIDGKIEASLPLYVRQQKNVN
jgi:hypothetical protein